MLYAPMADAPTDKPVTPDASWIISAFEVDQFNTKQHELGEKYVFYIDDSMVGLYVGSHSEYIHKARAITWMDDTLGSVVLGKSFRHNFGGKMRDVWITDVNGNVWYGRYPYQNQQCVNARLIKLGKQNG